ncbi:hypothetical protein DDSR119_10 [Pseudomonas phage DDSR119]|nr:hypothetical protein DDSR119_10 [Pseudomonas phage DDSR119]
MAKYQITRSPGLDWPVGAILETDKLHPSMRPHVRQISAEALPVEQGADEPKDPTADADPGEGEGDKPTPASKRGKAATQAAPADADDDNT